MPLRYTFFRLQTRSIATLLFLLAIICITGTTGFAQSQHKGQARSHAGGPSLPDPANCNLTFSDVQPTNYFYDGLRYLFCDGVVSGYEDNTFRPSNTATRGQLSKIIVLSKEWPLLSPAVPSFSDVPADSLYFPYVETAKAHGALGGYQDGTFRLNGSVSRGQLSKIVVSAQGWELLNPATPSFNDVAPDSPFYPYIETASAHSVLGGYSDGTFRPGNLATRGQITKVVYIAVTGRIMPPIPPPPTAEPTSTPTGFYLTPQEQQTVNLINARRAAMGLATLRVDPALTMAGRRHSSDIGPHGLCQHNGTDGSTPWERIEQAGYTGFGSGEVVGCHYSTPLDVVNGWWGSPGHLAVLTGAAINDIGCGWWIDPQGYGWQTCDVGTSNR